MQNERSFYSNLRKTLLASVDQTMTKHIINDDNAYYFSRMHQSEHWIRRKDSRVDDRADEPRDNKIRKSSFSTKKNTTQAGANKPSLGRTSRIFS